MELREGVESDLDWLEFVEEENQQSFYIGLYIARRELRCDIEIAGIEWQARANISAQHYFGRRA